MLAPASSEETLVESAAVPSATQQNTGLKNVCSPERMQVGEGEQYFSVLEKDPTMQVVRPLSRGCQLFGGPLLVGVLLLRPNHVALCPGSPPLLVEVLLYFIVLETQPCSLVPRLYFIVLETQPCSLVPRLNTQCMTVRPLLARYTW